MKCNFIGSFRLEELPNTAKPGDIAQLRLNKDQVYDDGHGHLLLDKDLIQVNKRNYWVKFNLKEFSIISNTSELDDDELKNELKIVEEYKDRNSRNLDRDESYSKEEIIEALDYIKEKEKEKYNCIIVIENDSVTTSYKVVTFNDQELEAINKLASSLPAFGREGIALSVIQLPNPIPNDIDKWYSKTPEKERKYIIYSPISDVYKKFKKKENMR